MSVLHCPDRSSTGWPLCPDCGDERTPFDDHGDCDLTALKSLALALSQGVRMSTCPRCESTDVATSVLQSSSGEALRSRCRTCSHHWGDGLPDSQDRPLPDGYEDCLSCDGAGDDYGRSCVSCRGDGIVQTALLG